MCVSTFSLFSRSRILALYAVRDRIRHMQRLYVRMFLCMCVCVSRERSTLETLAKKNFLLLLARNTADKQYAQCVLTINEMGNIGHRTMFDVLRSTYNTHTYIEHRQAGRHMHMNNVRERLAYTRQMNERLPTQPISNRYATHESKRIFRKWRPKTSTSSSSTQKEDFMSSLYD